MTYLKTNNLVSDVLMAGRKCKLLSNSDTVIGMAIRAEAVYCLQFSLKVSET